ncbi:hypothetical protein ACWB3E_18815 [Acinetobacter baumannii]
MSLSAIELLPGVHASFIGIIFAFFTAYAFYVYQKVNDIKDHLDKLIIEMSSYTHQFDDNESEFNLDYINTCAEKIKQIRLGLSVGSGMSEEDLKSELEKVYKAYYLLNLIISGTYDKFGFKPEIQSFNEKNYKANYNIYSEIYGIVEYYRNVHLRQITETHGLILKYLDPKIEERVSRELRSDFQKLGHQLADQEFKDQFTSRMEIERRMIYTKDQAILSNFQSNLDGYISFYNNEYRNIQKLISEIGRVTGNHDIYKISIDVFGFFILILILGILIPILILAKEDCLIDTVFTSWVFQIVLSVVSFAPYIYVYISGLKKIKSLFINS